MAEIAPGELKAAEQFIELVSGFEIGFEIAGAQPLSQVVKAPREQVQGRRENLAIRQYDIAPRGIGAPG